MAIYETDKILINGSTNCFGGVVFSCSLTQGYNGSPSVCEISCVAENRNYAIPDLSFKSTYNIKLGNNISLNLHATRYCVDDGDSGKILRVTFQDDIVRLRRWWIDLKSLKAIKTSTKTNTTSTPSTGLVGSAMGSTTSTSTTSTSSEVSIPNVIWLGKTADEISKENLPAQLYDYYNFEDFQKATAFLGIPSFPSNPLMVTNMRDTVLNVWNWFASAYGYSWFLDWNNKIQILNVKKPININPVILNNFESHSKRLSSQLCTDISNNKAQGTFAIEKCDTSSLSVLAGAEPFWNGNFLKIPFKIRDLGECIAATLGSEIFFYYVASQRGWKQALTALGYRVKEIMPISDSKASALYNQLKNDPYSIAHQTGDGDPLANLGVAVVELFENTEQVEFNIAEKIGELLKRRCYYVLSNFPDLDINWNVGSSQILDRDATIAESVDFWDVLDFSKVKSMRIPGDPGRGIPDKTLPPTSVKLRDIAAGDVWILTITPDEVTTLPKIYVKQAFDGSFSNAESVPAVIGVAPAVAPLTVYDAFPNIDLTKNPKLGTGARTIDRTARAITTRLDEIEKAFQEGITKAMTMAPQMMDIKPAIIDPKYSSDSYRLLVINKYNYKIMSSFFCLPNYFATKQSIGGEGTYKNAGLQNIYSANDKVIIASTPPVIDEKTAEISILTYDNPTDGTVDTKAFLQQAAFNRSQDDQQYQCEIRGISLGFSVGPEDGLTDIRISFSDQGYQTSYGLSTRQPQPADIETFRQKFTIN